MKSARELRAERASKLDKAKSLIDQAEGERRDLTTFEDAEYRSLLSEADRLHIEARKLESIPADLLAQNGRGSSGPYFHQGQHLGISNEVRALASFVKYGDHQSVDAKLDEEGWNTTINLPVGYEARANDTTWNETTAADGLNVVPVGLAGFIATRRNGVRISDKLGVRPIIGVGKKVYVGTEDADPNVLATTAEQSDAHNVPYERDAATLGAKAFTLVKKTKKLEVTEGLPDDEAAQLMNFIGDHIGRAIGLTHNAMLVAEVVADGTSLATFASASTIAAGEPEKLSEHDTLSYYLDEPAKTGWVMRPSTLRVIRGITGNSRLYADENLGSSGPMLLDYQVVRSNAVSAIGASTKSVLFANRYYMGLRESPVLKIIRDEVSTNGLVTRKYSFRAAYGLLTPAPVGLAPTPRPSL